MSTVLHELAHGYVAYWLGDYTAKANGRLSLNPLVHLDPVMSVAMPVLLYMMGAPILGGAKPVPVNTTKLKGREWGFAAVAIAGPLMNILLSFIFFLLWRFIGHSDPFWGGALVYGMQINMGFAFFNLIPIPPLDGSRVLYALAPEFAKRILESMEHMGIWIVYILLILGGNLFSSYIAGAEEGLLKLYIMLTGGGF